MAGLVQGTPTSVTVQDNGNSAQTATVYADQTFARPGVSLLNGANTFTAVAQDSYNRRDTNTVSAWLPASNAFTYDANGNLTGDGRRSFGYDDENQLTSVEVAGAWRTEFQYDGFGQRRVRIEKAWNGSAFVTGSEMRYVYDHLAVLQERDANNVPLVTYTRGRDLSGGLQRAGGIGGLLARTEHGKLLAGDPSAHAFYHGDAGGNVTALIDSRQTAVARYRYDPFGNALGQSGPLAEANTYRFSSKDLHAASGLYFYGYRYYEPSRGAGRPQDWRRWRSSRTSVRESPLRRRVVFHRASRKELTCRSSSCPIFRPLSASHWLRSATKRTFCQPLLWQ